MIYVVTIQEPHLMLIIELVATSSRAGYQVYLAQPWVLCTQTKAIQYNLGRWNQKMWLVSGRRQGMQTEGSALDPKCKLFILSFFTLPQLLDCFICTKNAISIALLLEMMGRWDRQGCLIYIRRVCVEHGYHLRVFVFFSSAFLSCSLTFSVSLFRWLLHDGCYISFSVFSLFSLSLVPLTRHEQSIEIVASVV